MQNKGAIEADLSRSLSCSQATESCLDKELLRNRKLRRKKKREVLREGGHNDPAREANWIASS